MILSHSFPLDTRTAFPSCMQISVRLSPLRFRENKCWHELIHHAISIDWQIYIYMEGFFRRFVSYQILYVWSKSTFSWIFSWIFFSHVVVIFICYLQYRKNNLVNRKLCQLVFSIAHRFSTRDGIETTVIIWSMKLHHYFSRISNGIAKKNKRTWH